MNEVLNAPSIVFHVPQPVEVDPKVGSRGHVSHMLNAFRDAGFEVEVVSGHSRERAHDIRRIKEMVRGGRQFDFLYSEATTIPTALTDPHHIPVRPFMDLRFFRFMRRRGVPVGLFYPDVHWRFDFNRKAVTLAKRSVAYVFYQFDLFWYRMVLDALFMPSRLMSHSVPGWRGSQRVVALFPGGHSEPQPFSASEGDLHLFYVGSVTPPLYGIEELLSAVRTVDGVRLTLCCPASERALIPDEFLGDRVEIIHEHGSVLKDRYAQCQIACLVYPPTDYRAFAMPMKLFEALGYGRPVIVAGGEVVDEFVRETDCGWVVESPGLASLLEMLRDNPDALQERNRIVCSMIAGNSWVDRAEQVAQTLRAVTNPRSVGQ